MNRVALIGRISRDIDLRYTTSGMAVCQINLAVNRPRQKDKEPEADFINIVVWDKQAENLAKYQKKGSQIGVEGKIQTRSYDNSEGKKVYVTEVVATNIEFLGSANKDTQGGQQSEQQNGQQAATQTTTEVATQDPYAEFGNQISVEDLDRHTVITDADLPF